MVSLPAVMCSPGLIFSWYQGLFPQGKRGKGVNLAANLLLVPRLDRVEIYLHSHICRHGVYKDNFTCTCQLQFLYGC
jgi:hypothetical protein